MIANNIFPASPLSFVLYLMVVMLRINNHLTDECAEIVMAFLNAALNLANDPFRFPKKIITLTRRDQAQKVFCNGITYYTVCPTCHQMYLPTSSKKYCNHITKVLSDRTVIACNESLHEKSSLANHLVPRKVYPYNSIISTLKKMFMRPNFVREISKWCSRPSLDGYLYDIYDGSVFKNFSLGPNLPAFTSQSIFNLMLTLNVDWYNVDGSSGGSCGSIYMTIQNLPKADGRDLKRNLVLVGIIPGPKEPSTSDMNHYLDPLVDELLLLMNGVTMNAMMPDGQIQAQKVKAALSMVCCDLPAAKKTSGFVSFHAICGCHRCKSRFNILANEGRRDWSGWNSDDWILRTKEENKSEAEAWKIKKDSGQNVKPLEDANGTRYSSLHKLPYFDAPAFTVIEPMHNLYLGTAKHMMNLWLSRDTRNSWVKRSTAEPLIDKQSLARFEDFFSNFSFKDESDGRSIVRKINIGPGFSYLKAAEWKIWCSTMSPLILRQVLDTERFNNFMLFVDALQILERNIIRLTDIDTCHAKLREFCIGFEHLYGKRNVTSNMHFHLHLAECIRMYGPISCFWAFNFERYNMFVKMVRTNHKKGFEKTFMVQMLRIIHAEDYAGLFEKYI